MALPQGKSRTSVSSAHTRRINEGTLRRTCFSTATSFLSSVPAALVSELFEGGDYYTHQISLNHPGTRKKSTFQKHIGSCTSSGRKLDATVPMKAGPDPLRAIRRRVVPHLQAQDQEPEYFWKPPVASATSLAKSTSSTIVTEPPPIQPPNQNSIPAWPVSAPFTFPQVPLQPIFQQPGYFMPTLPQWPPYEVQQQLNPELPFYQPFYTPQPPIMHFAPDFPAYQMPVAPSATSDLSALLQMLPRPGGLN